MSEALNNILAYLLANKRNSFKRRTKESLKQFANQEVINTHISTLSRDGYIRSYLHPFIGLSDDLNLDSDEKIFYSLTERGMKFLINGGYNKTKCEQTITQQSALKIRIHWRKVEFLNLVKSTFSRSAF